jgi:hypothetical protein
VIVGFVGISTGSEAAEPSVPPRPLAPVSPRGSDAVPPIGLASEPPSSPEGQATTPDRRDAPSPSVDREPMPAHPSGSLNASARPPISVNAPARPPRLPPPPDHTEEDILGPRWVGYPERREAVLRRGLALRWFGASTVGAGAGIAVGSVLGGLLIQDRSTMIGGAIAGGAIALLVGLPLWIAGNNRIADVRRWTPRKETRQRSDGPEDPRPSKAIADAVDPKEYRILCASLGRGELPSPDSWLLLHGKELQVTDTSGAEYTGTASILTYEPEAVTIESTRLLRANVAGVTCLPAEGGSEPVPPADPTEEKVAPGQCTIAFRARPTEREGKVEYVYDVEGMHCLTAGSSVTLNLHGEWQTVGIREAQRYDSLLILELSEPLHRADGTPQESLAFKRDAEWYLLMK